MALIAGVVSGCSGGEDGTIVPPAESVARLTLTPEAGETGMPVSTELGVTVTDGGVEEVTLRDEDGDAVSGAMRADGSAWVPDSPLEYRTRYTATASAVDAEHRVVTAETSFTTMAEPRDRVEASLWNTADYEYGHAMPVMIDFPPDFEVPEKHRAQVERRLFVTSDPPQPGVWHWFTGGHLEYRPESFWKPGSVVTVRAALEGVPLGGDRYGAGDVTRKIHFDDTARVIEVSNEDKVMVAKENGEAVKSMDISLGKASTPSYSGTMTVMEKLEHTVFDTTAQCGGRVSGDDCYRTPVDWAQRLTWSGQFIHSAPWSVADQGVRNVSHGCVNVSAGNAEWIFDFARVGDPVIITGTEAELPYGDGFTAFDLSWEEFREGSYLAGPGADADADAGTGSPDTDLPDVRHVRGAAHPHPARRRGGGRVRRY
ncbi:L,D-transpeptidase [Stackebrandtia albiflava]|uniref:L,D-transpeptidase n=1 Tax=Stackebrandtia albiflava TaxID=406432 RepID=UPI001FCEC32C|nr:Ig-like domain-containing protein [Stackebrandtia albiflava]